MPLDPRDYIFTFYSYFTGWSVEVYASIEYPMKTVNYPYFWYEQRFIKSYILYIHIEYIIFLLYYYIFKYNNIKAKEGGKLGEALELRGSPAHPSSKGSGVVFSSRVCIEVELIRWLRRMQKTLKPHRESRSPPNADRAPKTEFRTSPILPALPREEKVYKM